MSAPAPHCSSFWCPSAIIFSRIQITFLIFALYDRKLKRKIFREELEHLCWPQGRWSQAQPNLEKQKGLSVLLSIVLAHLILGRLWDWANRRQWWEATSYNDISALWTVFTYKKFRSIQFPTLPAPGDPLTRASTITHTHTHTFFKALIWSKKLL